MLREGKSVRQVIELDERLRRANAAMEEWIISLTPEDKEKEPVKRYLEIYDKVTYALNEAKNFVEDLSVS